MTPRDLVVCQCVLCLRTDPKGCEVSSVLRSRHRKVQAIHATLQLLDQAQAEPAPPMPEPKDLDHKDLTPTRRTPKNEGAKTDQERAAAVQHSSTLKNITLGVIRESNSISRPETLRFVASPSPERHQEICWENIQQELNLHSSMAKFYKYNFILSEAPENQAFSRSESVLRGSLQQIDALTYLLGPTSESSQAMLDNTQRLRRVAVDALSQLLAWKRDIWIAQAQGMARTNGFESGNKASSHIIRTVDTAQFLVTAKGLQYHPLVLSSIVHVVISNLIFGLPHKGCEALLRGFRNHTQMAVDHSRGWLSSKLPECIPKTLTGAFQHLNLSPSLRQYIVCPHCHCLYPSIQPYPMRCVNRPIPRAPGCQASLLMQRRINGKPVHTPIKTYLHQDFNQWLARLLCRPGIESMIRSSQHPPGRSQDGTVTDILGSDAIRSFLGTDGLPFLRPVDGQYRLIFALSADGFNPLTNKQAKQVRSSTAIYLICLNLPLSVRQLPHNMYLVGVVPGPRKLKEGEINHYLDLVVDDLMPFWEPGVSFTSTALRSNPTLCLAAIIPIICDALGAREVSGFPPINSMPFCIFCPLPLCDVENFDFTKWSKRTCADHRALAEEWRSAGSAARLVMQKACHPARYTSLLRLPYFDPVSFTTIDTMHLLYLGLFQRHCRQIWGMDVKLEDGDGSKRGYGSTPLPPSDEDIEEGRLILISGRMERFFSCKIKKDVLYQLCEENGLRTGGKKRDLIQELTTFIARRDQSQNDNANQITPTSSVPPLQTVKQELDLLDMPAITEKVKADFRVAESRLVKNMSLKKCSNDPLKLMCYLRGLKFEQRSPVKQVMIDALQGWRQEQTRMNQWIPRMDASQLETLAAAQQNLRRSEEEAITPGPAAHPLRTAGDPTKSKPKPKRPKSAVLGSGVLGAYVVDRQNMVLPSWITAPPAKAGHADHGKMSADQWRVFCTVNLPVTLIRIWSPRQSEPRWNQMLLNFLDLVIAVEIASLVVTSPALIAQYESLMHRYLESLKSIYKDAPIVQNHHLALHVGDVMRMFGPTPGFRAYATERFNYLLQRVKTNRHELGEIEMTMTRSVCRASNLIGLLEHPSAVPKSMGETVSRILKGDQRGTRVNDVPIDNPDEIRDLPQHRNPSRQQGQLDDHILEGLTEYLNRNGPNSPAGTCYVPCHGQRAHPADVYLHSEATFLRLLVVDRVSYRPSRNSTGSSHVLVKGVGDSQRPAIIQCIFRHSRHSYAGIKEEPFLVVRLLKALTQREQDLDPYRKVNKYYGHSLCPFRDVFGSLWRLDTEEKPIIIRPSQLICHFAWTTLSVQSISGSCAHVQPLSRLKTQFELNEWLDECDSDVEMNDEGGGEGAM